MRAKSKLDITTDRERELEEEMQLVDREIQRALEESESIESQIVAIRSQATNRLLLLREASTQTTIEDSSSQLFQTNHMQLYRIFGVQSMLWQLVHDEIMKYPEYVTFLEKYHISGVTQTEEGGHKQISLRVSPEAESRKLRPSVLRSGGTNLSLQTLIVDRKFELLEFCERKDFAQEMGHVPISAHYNNKVDVGLLTGYLQAQNKNVIDSLLNRSAKAVYKSKKFEAVLAGIKDSNRATVWRKLIGNRLKITPELYFYFRTLSETNFPPQVERTINEDLKRVLRYYLKGWDLELVKQEYRAYSGYQRVKDTPLEPNYTQAFDNFAWEFTDRLRIFENLREICRCFQVFRTDIGYVQGMCRISFFFYTVFQNNIEAFTAMANFLLQKEPMLSCYKFDQDVLAVYETAVRKFLPRTAPQCAKALLRDNDRLISVFMMENLFTLFSNYFEEADAK